MYICIYIYINVRTHARTGTSNSTQYSQTRPHTCMHAGDASLHTHTGTALAHAHMLARTRTHANTPFRYPSAAFLSCFGPASVFWRASQIMSLLTRKSARLIQVGTSVTAAHTHARSHARTHQNTHVSAAHFPGGYFIIKGVEKVMRVCSYGSCDQCGHALETV